MSNKGLSIWDESILLIFAHFHDIAHSYSIFFHLSMYSILLYFKVIPNAKILVTDYLNI